MSKCRWSLRILLVFIFSVSAQLAKADSITFVGALSSDSTAVSSTDPVITDPTAIHLNDPFSILLTFNPLSFTNPTSNSFVLTDASLTLSFDGFSFLYISAAGNFIEFATPGAFGPGTVSFQVCSSAAACSTTDFLNLFFTGSVTNLGTLAAQAGSYRLTGNLTIADANTDGIDITADNVTLDLNGFTIAGPVTCTGQPRQPVTSCTPAATGIGVASSKMNASVFNGSVQGFHDGILFGNSIGVSNSRVEEVNASQNSTFGIAIDGAVRHLQRQQQRQRHRCRVRDRQYRGFQRSLRASAQFASGNIAIANGADGLFVDVEGIANLNVLAGNGQDLELAGNPLAISSGNNNCSGHPC